MLLIPIGGNFTMDPADAAYATREWIKPKVVVPMHLGTNPLARGTLAEFEQAMVKVGPTRVLPLTPGIAVQF